MAGKKFVALNVFYGDETYLLDRSKEKALAWPDRQVTILEGPSVTDEEVISAMDEFSFDGTERAVVLESAEKVKLTKAFFSYLQSRYPEGQPHDTSTVLVAIVRAASLPKTWSELTSKGRVIGYQKFKPWEEAKIRKRVEEEAARLDLTLDAEAFAMLYRIYAENTGGMANELGKLAFLVGPGGVVTKDHVLSVCSKQMSVMPWDVSDAAGKKSVRKALTLAGLLVKYEGEGASVPIVAMLMKQVERLAVARSLVDQGRPSKEIAAAINMSPFVYEKNYASAVKKHTTAGLLNQMKKLCELEIRVKGQSPSKRTLVDLAILSLAK